VAEQPVSLRTVLSALPSFSRSELQNIRQRCQVLMQSGTTSVTPIMEEEDWLLLGMMTETKRRGQYVPARFRADRGSSFGSYNTKAAQVRDILELCAPGLNLVEKRALGEVAAKALADMLTNRDLDATFHNMLLRVDRIPAALEREYPGYLESRMLGITVRK
jgi:hypothetical protein